MSLREGTKREPISLAIKDSIRSFYRAHEKMSINDMILWAQEKYEIPFLPATMRTILFPKQKPTSLWAGSQTSRAERKRERFPSWPELELELSKWYTSTKTPPKGQDLKAKAIELWRELAPNHYVEQKQPSFGDSWRDKFKSRHGFKRKWASVPGMHMETEAAPFHGRAKNTGNLLNVYNETSINRLMPFPTTSLGQLEVNVASSLQNADQLLPLVGRKEKTPRQYRKSSMPLTELTRNEPEDTVLETRPSSGHRTMSPPLDSQYMRSQLRTVTDGTNSCPIPAYATNLEDIKVTGSGAHRRKRQFNPTAVVGQIKRRRINNMTSPDYHSMSLYYEPDSGEDMSECILNLSRMVSNGQQYFSTHLVRNVIDTILSEVEVSKSFIPEEKCRRIFSPYRQAKWSRIEFNRLVSMDALSLLKSAKIFNIHQPQLQAWLEWESQILFDSFIQFLPEDCEPEDPCLISNGSSKNGKGAATDGAVSYQHNPTAADNLRKRSDTMFSMRSKRGRIDIRVSKPSPCESSYESYSTAEIIFTPSGTAQLRFFLKQHVTQEATVLLTPTLSIFNTIPNDSEVFEIAAYGTVDDLREIFSSGKASLSDCDRNGRSLINASISMLLSKTGADIHQYALSNFNVEIVNYLLEFVKEIDTYEFNQFGDFCPLIFSTLASPYGMSEWKHERRIRCFKRMVDKGADPTLGSAAGYGDHISIISIEIQLGSKGTIQAIIDSGHPLINPSSIDDNDCALLVSLAEWFRYGGTFNFEIIHKIMFLLERGAEPQSLDKWGDNCLHLVLATDFLSKTRMERNKDYHYQEFRSILMALVTAGVDIDAVGDLGRTPSDIALKFGHEDLWTEVLANCGYHPRNLFKVHNENPIYPGMSIFSAADISVRPTKLSFQEFSSQLGSLEVFEIPKPDFDWWKNCAACVCGMDGSETDSEYWSDNDGEYWSDNDSDIETSWCHDTYKDIDTAKAGNHQGTDYRPINGDPTWLAYIHRHRFLWYWPPSPSSRSGDSSDEDGYETDEYIEFL